jgi:hypothetical protein
MKKCKRFRTALLRANSEKDKDLTQEQATRAGKDPHKNTSKNTYHIKWNLTVIYSKTSMMKFTRHKYLSKR